MKNKYHGRLVCAHLYPVSPFPFPEVTTVLSLGTMIALPVFIFLLCMYEQYKIYHF